MDRLHRTRLLIGDSGIDKLRDATVMVVGCGAVGSFAVEALARTGIGHLIVVDFDTVEESNINRQLFALNSTLGLPKVDVAASRIRDISPDISVEKHNLFWNSDTDLPVHPDFVIDAIDSVDSKIALYKWCVGHDVPFVSCMGAARKTDVSQICTAKLSKTRVCPLAAKIRKLVRGMDLPDFDVVYSAEVANSNVHGREFGSLITVTGTFGLVLASGAIKYILSK